MSWPQELLQWIEMIRQDRTVAHTLIWLVREQGGGSDRAQQEALDALEEAITRSAAAYRLGNFTAYSHYRNWVRRTAVNWLRDQQRYSCRLRKHQPALLRVDLALYTPRQLEMLYEELERLGEQDQQLLRLKYFDNMTLEELADCIDDGLPRRGRTLRLFRRICRLREQLRGRLEARDFESSEPPSLHRTTE